MAHTEMTCILCPIGCRLTVSKDEGGVTVKGNGCKRGEQYGAQELLSPMRVVTSSVRVDGAELPLCPVKTVGQVPKASIDQVICEIRKARAKPPLKIGQVIIPDVAGTGVSVVATANRN